MMSDYSSIFSLPDNISTINKLQGGRMFLAIINNLPYNDINHISSILIQGDIENWELLFNAYPLVKQAIKEMPVSSLKKLVNILNESLDNLDEHKNPEIINDNTTSSKTLLLYLM
jgi:hypothetical protein